VSCAASATGVALVAAHTPETIPHRPRIEVLRGGVD